MKQVIMTCLFILITTQAYCKDVTLSWDKNDDASYYIIYYGTSSLDYTVSTEAIVEEQYTVHDLTDDVKYYFAVKAFNDCGNSSDFSEEVSTEDDYIELYILTGCTMEHWVPIYK